MTETAKKKFMSNSVNRDVIHLRHSAFFFNLETHPHTHLDELLTMNKRSVEPLNIIVSGKREEDLIADD